MKTIKPVLHAFIIFSLLITSSQSVLADGDSINNVQSDPISTRTESACKKATAIQKDGYLAWDQTEVKDRDGLINHLMDAGMGVLAGYTLITTRCRKLAITPSFYLYNGASVVSLISTVMNIMNNKKASKEKLEALLNVDADEMQKQIDLYYKAAEQTEDAAKAAKKREQIAKIVKMAKMAAVVAAAVEFGLTKIPNLNLEFLCYPKGSGVTNSMAAEQATDTLQAYRSGLRTSGGVSGIIGMVRNILKEDRPMDRIINYGVSFIIFDVVMGSSNDSSQCLEERAREYRLFADALKARYGTDGNSENVKIVAPTIATGDQIGGVTLADFSRDDFGCTVQTSEGLKTGTQYCDCAAKDKNTCYKIPQSTLGSAAKGGISLPNSVRTSLANARNFENAVLSGDVSAARIAANGLEQSAFKVRKAFENAKKKINADRIANGQKPIDFDAESRKRYNQLRKAAGSYLDQNGITNMAQLNDHIAAQSHVDGAEELQKALEAAAPTNGGVAKINQQGGSNSSTESGNFDFLGDDLEGSQYKPSAQQDGDNLQDQLAQLQQGDTYSRDSGRNLFEMITRRYLESGYPKLLEKKPEAK